MKKRNKCISGPNSIECDEISEKSSSLSRQSTNNDQTLTIKNKNKSSVKDPSRKIDINVSNVYEKVKI